MTCAPSGHDAPPRRSAVRRRVLWLAACAALFAGAAVALDFARFVDTMQRGPVGARADGIVVLTGGEQRIPQGMDLLAGGRAQRLLITGVNPATSPEALSVNAPGREYLLACCVDLDHNALNTVGNAIETARWVRDRHFRSIIVVTANYHMPRSLLELRRVLPDIELIAYPVAPQGLHLEGWWHDGATLRLLIAEYVKYTGASVGLRFEPATATQVRVASTRL